jgi:hypothetical protein
MRVRVRSVLGAILLAASSAGGACSSESSGSNADAASPAASLSEVEGPGCSPRTPALAHAGGAALANRPGDGPIACASAIAQTTDDPSIVVATSGDLIFAPAGSTGVVRSHDGGKSWGAPLLPPSAPTTALAHPWLWRDGASHRIYYNLFFGIGGTGACSDGSGAELWTSDDDGVTWSAPAPVGCGSKDFGQIMTGPAATAADKAGLAKSGYPSALYYCATGPTLIVGPDRFCFRSLDGGRTFTRTKTEVPGRIVILSSVWSPGCDVQAAVVGCLGTVSGVSEPERCGTKERQISPYDEGCMSCASHIGWTRSGKAKSASLVLAGSPFTVCPTSAVDRLRAATDATARKIGAI